MTVIDLPLPDRATVERATTSIWQAPLDVRPVPDGLTHHADHVHDPPALEAGTTVAAPQVLHRRDHHAAVVLTRLTAVDSMLSMELLSTANACVSGPGATVAVIRGHEAFWLRPGDGSSSGGDQTFSCLQEFTLARPHDDLLDLIVAWPPAGLDDVRVHVPLRSWGVA